MKLLNRKGNAQSLQAVHAHTVTPHDTNNLTGVATYGYTSGVYVGGAGNLVVTMNSGSDCTFTGVPAGTFLPINITKIKTTSTATNIVALY